MGNKKGELVSIIVPVHNTSNYLDKCLTSLITQTYTDIEIILIDNNSIDNSYDICFSYASKDKRVKLITANEKSGSSYARNCGLKIAEGDYITFVDSDDYIDSNFICINIQKLIETESDILIGRIDKEGVETNHFNQDYIFSIDNNYNSFAFYAKRNILGAIFTKEMTTNILFNENIIIGEDLLFYTSCLVKAKRVIYNSSSPAYHYIIHEDSTYNSKNYYQEYTNIVAHYKVKNIIDKTGYKKAANSAKKYYMYKCNDLINAIKSNHSKEARCVKRKLIIHLTYLIPFVMFSTFKVRFKLKWLLYIVNCVF